MVVLARFVDEACHIIISDSFLSKVSQSAQWAPFNVNGPTMYAIILTPADSLSFRPHINS